MNDTRQFVVDRQRWLRGGELDTRLLNAQGNMCCLGFVCAQRGIPPGELLDKCEPDDLRDYESSSLVLGVLLAQEGSGWIQSRLALRAIEINDNRDIEDAEREKHLSTLFDDYGFEMAFVGEGRP